MNRIAALMTIICTGLAGASVGFCVDLIALPLAMEWWGLFELAGPNEMVFGPVLVALGALVEGMFVGGIFGALGGAFARRSWPPLAFGFGALLITLSVALVAESAVTAVFFYVDLVLIAVIAAAVGRAIRRRIVCSQQDPDSPGPPPPPPAAGPSSPSQDEKTMATLCHLSALVLGFIGPLIIWLLKKEQMPFVDDHGKEAMNFQIMVLIALMVSVLLTCLGGNWILIFLAVFIFDQVMIIIASMRANTGDPYRYPVSIRFIK